MTPISLATRSVPHRGEHASKAALTEAWPPAASNGAQATVAGVVHVCDGVAWGPDLTVAQRQAVVSGAGNVVAGSRKVVTLGASITNGSSASNAGTLSYSVRLWGYCSEHKVAKGVQRFGYPGQSAEYIAAQVGTALASNPDILILGPDFGTNLPAVTDSGTDPATAFGRHVLTVRDACRAAGVRLVVCMTLPQGAGVASDVQKGIAAQNAWLAQYAAKNGLDVIDTHSPLIDQATGVMAASYYTGPDIIHPIDAGHDALASTIGGWLSANLTDLPWPVQAGGSGLVANPLMVGTVASNALTGWSTVSPNSYTGTVTVETANRVDATDLPIGRWYKLTCDSTSGSGTHRKGATAITVVPGEKLIIAAYGKATGNGVVAIVLWGTGSIERLVLGTLVNGAASVPLLQEYTVPDGVTTLYPAIRITANSGQVGVGYIGAVDVYRPAALGLL